ncbi:tryptophan dimethylallyltransferase family protein [Saccharopolyspora pogona]|uniref:tryptophan dimethylallyltransferase family protein n=1 Tax=Saccharopolyspora pogona TaxID=333966 RepID=UPI001CC25BDB|nr:tryptophan dimethylallyltransferase family protein [Saccharopolyspora pogona]
MVPPISGRAGRATAGFRVDADSTFLDYGVSTAAKLLKAAGLDVATGESVLRDMIKPWGACQIGRQPSWYSDVCADGSPLEFSAGFTDSGVGEIRVLTEAIPAIPDPVKAQIAARKLTQVLIENHGAAADRLNAVADLFLPARPSLDFAMMHGVIFKKNKAPEFKIYLNPAVDDTMTASERVRSALARLGLSQAWAAITDYARRGFDLDRVVYFGLDLSHEPGARIKVYFRHYDITSTELDTAMATVQSHQPGALEPFCRKLTGLDGRFSIQPLVSCLTFTSTTCIPVAATAYVPLWTYADNDQEIHDRVRQTMLDASLPADRYSSLLHEIAGRPLDEGCGIHTYASLLTHRASYRMVLYWSAELYDRHPSPRYQDR